ncbi:M23 family metallopeptidase [Kribbella sp. NPDC006257]|uniref:M23 family metallopeptidase n=1 Tax=Kribbella sp. NPDC006257 TaxID=3156738 RepID=UPI0033B6AC1D
MRTVRRTGARRTALLLTLMVGLAGIVLPSPAEAAGSRPDFHAPWNCGESRSYSHHDAEVTQALDFIGAPGGDLGSPVLASAAGTVVSAGVNGGYGNEVVVSHGGGWSSRVAHLSVINVSVGQQVEAGQILGLVGSTGNSTGPHLHYEQLADGVQAPIVLDGTALEYRPTPTTHVGRNCPIQRFAFVNAAGQVFAKDGSHSPWPGALNGGGASKVVLSGQWIGILDGTNFWAKSGINGAWKLMAQGAGTRDIAIDGDRFAVVNAAGQVLVKDGADSPWSTPINGGGATKVVLDSGWIGILQGGNFLAKFDIFGTWKVLTGGNDVIDIAIDGNRFGFVNGAGQVFVKDGADSPWPNALNGGGATRIELQSSWIAILQGGNFLAKFDIFGTWKTLADGGQVTDITLGANGWFGFIGSGDFYAKQGADNPWLGMAGGGQVRDITLET